MYDDRHAVIFVAQLHASQPFGWYAACKRRKTADWKTTNATALR